MLAALLLITPTSFGPALAGPNDVDIRLLKGGEFRGAVVAHDDEGFTL